MANSVAARWYLEEPLDLDWRLRSLCRLRQDLPWTPDVEPDVGSLAQMRVLCGRCPVRGRCAEYGLSQPGGFYAGVWTPWKDGARLEGDGGERGARFASRQSLREVRDSATHDGLPLNSSRSCDERSAVPAGR